MSIKNIRHTHAADQILHSQRRFKQYYHTKFTKSMRSGIKTAIKDGLATIVDNNANKYIVYNVPFSGKRYIVVYDPETTNIVTFLPQNYYKRCQSNIY